MEGTLTSHIEISSMIIWRWTGYNALIYLAAMQSIPKELYESASLDGASGWQQFIYVTLPGIRNVMIFTPSQCRPLVAYKPSMSLTFWVE